MDALRPKLGHILGDAAFLPITGSMCFFGTFSFLKKKKKYAVRCVIKGIVAVTPPLVPSTQAAPHPSPAGDTFPSRGRLVCARRYIGANSLLRGNGSFPFPFRTIFSREARPVTAAIADGTFPIERNKSVQLRDS